MGGTTGPRYEVLVGSGVFWERARQDIEQARERVVLQAMTFEGDRTGLDVVDALLASNAPDRRILVDTYSRVIVSDRFVVNPLARRDPAFVREVEDTREMFLRLERDGAGVRFTNPVGPLLMHFPQRNHKKLIVVDDRIGYIGGINFSDHNFEWHDLMVRIEDPAIGAHLTSDFDATWNGDPVPGVTRFDDAEIHSFDGRSNDEVFRGILSLIESARDVIHVVSPYLTFPFCEALAAARRRGVRIVVLTPDANNKGVVRDYLLWESQRLGFEVRLYDAMSHLKAMLVDDDALVVGSSNFDFVSYHTQDELVAVLKSPEVIAEFRAKCLDADLARSRPLEVTVKPLRGRASYLVLKAMEAGTRLSRRVVPHSYRARLSSATEAYGP